MSQELTLKSANKPVHYPALDGLRGVAILLVLLNHQMSWVPLFGNYFYVGVDLFFVLSGFLITEILIRETGTPHYFHNFYVKRIFRILPVYFLVFILGIVAISLIPDFTGQLTYYSKHILFYIFYLQNWSLILYPPDTGYIVFAHFWSLGIEEQFYLFFPLAVLMLKGGQRLFYFLIVAILIILLFRIGAYHWMQPGVQRLNTTFMSRYDGICVGAMIAVAKNCKTKLLYNISTIIFCLIPIIYFFYALKVKWTGDDSAKFFIFGYTVIAFLFGLILRNAIQAGSWMYRLFNFQVLNFFGKISFGLYLIHFPVMVLGWYFMNKKYHLINTGDRIQLFCMSFLLMGISIGLSYLSYKYFESPILRKRKYFLK